MLITKTVKIKWNSRTKEYYENLGYVWAGKGVEFEIPAECLPDNSSVIVEWECLDCGEHITSKYSSYKTKIKKHGYAKCNKCMRKEGKEKRDKINLEKSKNFEQWCIENKRFDVLARWDYEKNGCKPSEVSYGSTKKMWFKCLIHPEHHSEEKRINDFTSGHEGVMDCKQCNSIMQKLIDLNLVHHLNLKKNYDLGLDLWSISCGSSKIKLWFLCQEKDYHNDFDGYEMSSVNFLAGHRCPYCASRKTHPKDSVGQAIIDMYDEEYLWKIWNKELNKGLDPFKISSNSKIKIWWNCPDGRHKPFLRSCDSSIFCNFNCNKCSYDRMIGENSPRWNPNLTDEDRQNSRGYQEYIQFVKDVMARDNYTCQITGVVSNGHNLVVHHLDGYNWCKERRVDVVNGIVIHEDIHKLFHHIYGYGNNTEEQFEEFLMKIESKEIDISNIN